MQKSKLTLRALTEGAIFVALAQVISYLKLFELPQGGSITVGMLPIFLYCARWGFGPGMLASFVYSLLQLLLDGAYAWGWQSMLGDYIVAFTVLGFAGLFHKQNYGFFTGTVVGSLARFLVHYVVGATVWAEYMPENFFGMTMHSPWFYSMLYNGSYMLIDMIFCLIIGLLVWKPLGKYIRGEDLKRVVRRNTKSTLPVSGGLSVFMGLFRPRKCSGFGVSGRRDFRHDLLNLGPLGKEDAAAHMGFLQHMLLAQRVKQPRLHRIPEGRRLHVDVRIR